MHFVDSALTGLEAFQHASKASVFLLLVLLLIFSSISSANELHLKVAHLLDSTLVYPINVKVCLVKHGVQIDEARIKETLLAIQSQRSPVLGSDGNVSKDITFVYTYGLSSDSSCRSDANIVLTIKDDASFTRDTMRLRDGVVEGVFNVPRGTYAESTGRIAGWIVAAANIWLGSDIRKNLFFSLYEDDGIEISIVGFHRSGEDPLNGLDIDTIRLNIAEWIGIDLNKTIVKATSRRMQDHPGVLAAILKARNAPNDLAEDQASSKSQLDAVQFIQAVSQSSDSLLRMGTAARLVRLRRREVQVYVVAGQRSKDSFQQGRRVFVHNEDVAILVPPTAPPLAVNLTKLVLLGLATSVTGVPLVETASTMDWVGMKAQHNLMLFEIHKIMEVAREALRMERVREKVSLSLFAETFEKLRLAFLQNEWSEAKSLVRGQLRNNLKSILRISRIEKKRCCRKALVNESSGSSKSKRRSIFIYLYLVMTLIILGGLALFAMLRNNIKQVNLVGLFGRSHLD